MGRNQKHLKVTAVAALLFVGVPLMAASDDTLRQKALQLNDVTGKDPIKGKILELYGDKPALKNLITEAAAMVKEKEKDPPFNYNGAYILARSAALIKDYDNSLVFYKICKEQAIKLHSGQKILEVYDGLIGLFNEQKKYDDVVKVCWEIINDIKGDDRVEGAKSAVLEQLIVALSRQQKFDEALKYADNLVNAYGGTPLNWYYLHLKAGILRDAGKSDEAVGAYEDTIEMLKKADLKDEDRERYVDSCRYALSGVFTDMDKIDKAAEQLQRLLKAHPDSSTFNNDLGYVWADHDMNLDESEKMIRKALDIDKAERKKLRERGLIDEDEDKDNAAYLDSLGWVLYKKKNYTEAKKYLIEATKSDEGKHVEIFDHLGDVHKALGEKGEAIDVWKKALQLENVSKRDDARKDAIRKKLSELGG